MYLYGAFEMFLHELTFTVSWLMSREKQTATDQDKGIQTDTRAEALRRRPTDKYKDI